jgi:predicted dehydrogenase
MSECTSNATLAEGVALCRAVEKSGKIYMLAENYPYTKFNLEMRRVYQTGEIGRVLYAEGEYNHPMGCEENASICLGENHWRNWLPSTYYCTHALAPLMMITDTMPTMVNGLAVAAPDVTEADYAGKHNDPTSVILCRMDNGSVFRIFGLWTPGHSGWYRVHGTRGAMEVPRGHGYFGTEQVRVWHEEWHCGEGIPADRTYVPDWPEHGDLASKAGHGGGDFWTNFEFANAIRSGKQPFLDVYRGVAMSSVGILAWKSALENGAPFEMPDWKKESSRKKWENDEWSPFPSHADRQPNQPPPSILGENKPSARNMAKARRLWKKHGWKGK